MNTDFRTSSVFWDDTRFRKLATRLNGWGGLCFFILKAYVARVRATGVLYNMDEEDIETVADWHGERGAFVKNLVELGFIFKNSEGVYEINEWRETNPWAADAINREDKARLSGMARFYPELYEELTAQGATGISKEEFARMTAEYNRRGIVCSLPKKSKKCDAYAPRSNAPTPFPAPVPAPAPDPVPAPTPTPVAAQPAPTESTATAQASSSQRKEALETPSKAKDAQSEPVESTEATESTQLTFDLETPNTPENLSGQGEKAVTLEDVINQWKSQLGSMGFQKVSRITPRRKSAFKARIRASQERSSRAWWVSLFDKIAASDFMRESAAQKVNWLTIDWVLNEQNMVKILEGKYDNDRPRKAQIHRDAGTTARAKTQPTTIRRLTHEEMSGPVLYKWEIEHGYDAVGRKKSVVLEAEVEETTPALDMPQAQGSGREEMTSEDWADIQECLDEYYAEKEAAARAREQESDDSDNGDTDIPAIRRIGGGL